MSTAAGFKRLGLAIAGVLAAVAVVVIAGPLFIPREAVLTAVKSEIKAATGLDLMVRGQATVSLLPWGNVSLSDVVLAGASDDEPALAAKELHARLRLVPLLFGRIGASDLSLVHAHLAVIVAPDGTSNWSGLSEKLARTLMPEERVTAISEIRIADGTVAVRDKAHGIDESLSGVEMSFAWPAIARSFAATGRFVWRNEAIDASVSVADLVAALTGARAGLKVRLNGAPFKIAFDGHIARTPTFRLGGTLAADTGSLRAALAWAGLKPLPGGGFGRFALKAHMDVLGGTLALSAVNVEMDGNSAEGVMAFTNEGRNVLQGTLAADELDLTPFLSTLHVLRTAERDWSSVPIVLDGLTGLDLDLRVSARRISLGTAALGRTAIGANLRQGRLTVAIGQSQAFGGVLTGFIAIGKTPGGGEVESQLQFANVDLETCLGDLFAIRRLEGKGTLSLALNASGDSVLAFTRTLNGSVTLSAQQGAVLGYNVEQLLRRLESRPLAARGEFRTGRTPFDKLNVSVKLVRGMARVEEVRLDGAAIRLGIVGSASVPARDLDLKGTASLIPAGATADTPADFELPFVVQGPWDDPVMLPDTELLLRRSGAAAPLFEQLRGKQP
ncbi:MAG TPA: AsmA family protein [Xanthobacteraceae bacterium]|nr:AsmA family protein [Xanthobacteraceae bacterium]